MAEAKVDEELRPVIWPINLPAASLFYACGNQWDRVVTPRGRILRTGLRLPDVHIRAQYLPQVRALDQDQLDGLWRDIDRLQRYALEALAEELEAENDG